MEWSITWFITQCIQTIEQEQADLTWRTTSRGQEHVHVLVHLPKRTAEIASTHKQCCVLSCLSYSCDQYRTLHYCKINEMFEYFVHTAWELIFPATTQTQCHWTRELIWVISVPATQWKAFERPPEFLSVVVWPSASHRVLPAHQSQIRVRLSCGPIAIGCAQ